MFFPLPEGVGLPPCLAVPEDMGVRHTIALAPRAPLAQRQRAVIPAHYLPSEWQAPVTSSQAEWFQVLILLVRGQLVRGTDRLWLTAEAKKLAAHASGTSQCLSELSRCCHKTQNLVLWWEVLCTAACSEDGVLWWQEILGKIRPGTAQGSRANFAYKKSCFFCLNTVKMQRFPLLSPTSFSGADTTITREWLKISLMYCRNWKQKAGFKCIFCNDSVSLVWDAVAVLSFTVVLHADRSYFLLLLLFH